MKILAFSFLGGEVYDFVSFFEVDAGDRIIDGLWLNYPKLKTAFDIFVYFEFCDEEVDLSNFLEIFLILLLRWP